MSNTVIVGTETALSRPTVAESLHLLFAKKRTKSKLPSSSAVHLLGISKVGSTLLFRARGRHFDKDAGGNCGV